MKSQITEQKLLIYTHQIINYYAAILQGYFAKLNIFSQFKHPLFSLESLQATKQKLLEAKSLLERLFSHELIFKPGASLDDLQIQKKIQEFFKAEIKDLQKQANRIKQLVNTENYYQNHEDVCFLIASFGQLAYLRDNYQRGIFKFNKSFNLQTNQTWEAHLEKYLKQNLELTAEFIKLYKSQKNQGANFYEHLRFTCKNLPGLLRAQAHDLMQIMAGLKENFSFTELGFQSFEADAWKAIGFDAIKAGYWRAFDFGTKEALAWESFGIKDPFTAGEWYHSGFVPESALPWIEVLFAPLLAIQWQQAGFTPKDSALLVRLGYYLPSEVPSDKVDELIQQSLDELNKDNKS